MKNHFIRSKNAKSSINTPIESVIFSVCDPDRLHTLEDISSLVNNYMIKNGESTINNKVILSNLLLMVKSGNFQEINGQKLFLWLKNSN